MNISENFEIINFLLGYKNLLDNKKIGRDIFIKFFKK